MGRREGQREVHLSDRRGRISRSDLAMHRRFTSPACFMASDLPEGGGGRVPSSLFEGRERLAFSSGRKNRDETATEMSYLRRD